jgi:hypothetical protein
VNERGHARPDPPPSALYARGEKLRWKRREGRSPSHVDNSGNAPGRLPRSVPPVDARQGRRPRPRRASQRRGRVRQPVAGTARGSAPRETATARGRVGGGASRRLWQLRRVSRRWALWAHARARRSTRTAQAPQRFDWPGSAPLRRPGALDRAGCLRSPVLRRPTGRLGGW